MSLVVRCTVTIENQNYEGEISEGIALEASSSAAVAPGSFNTVSREHIEHLFNSAIINAKKNVVEKLNVLKGEYEA